MMMIIVYYPSTLLMLMVGNEIEIDVFILQRHFQILYVADSREKSKNFMFMIANFPR
jgi:hypothetical protein